MIHLDNWQKEVLAYKGDLLLCTGRRVGKTYILARKAVDRMVEKKTDIIIFSLTEEQAMIIIVMMETYLRQRYPDMISKKKQDTNKKTITLKNGSKARSRPAGDTGDSGRGFDGGIVIVDEASRMNKLFWISASPIILMKAGEIWMSSTPHGKQGYFWDRFNESYNLKDPEARFKVFYITTEEVIKTREITSEWTESHRDKVLKTLEQEKKSMTTSEYLQEYCGMFLDDLRRFFPDEAINRTAVGKRHVRKGLYFLSADIARMGEDRICYDIFCKDGDITYHIESIIKRKQDLYKTEQDIIQLAKTWNVEKIGIDSGSGSLGVTVYDHLLQEPFTSRKVVAMTNQKISMNRDGTDKQRLFKEDMYQNLLYMMETNKIVLLDDEDVKQDLINVQIEVEDGKTKIFSHPSADKVESIVRGAYLAQKAKVNKVFLAYC